MDWKRRKSRRPLLSRVKRKEIEGMGLEDAAGNLSSPGPHQELGSTKIATGWRFGRGCWVGRRALSKDGKALTRTILKVGPEHKSRKKNKHPRQKWQNLVAA